mmetsp:Transcript_110228/g.212398  ORF Transcript_110228/g.212398 Transcript_110228/m.212398 type:complete len:601 (+) Transcript_110228:73-1875(+)
MGPETFAYLTAIMVIFVDWMGLHFTMPVTVPYGRWMGADLEVIALFGTVRGLLCLLSLMWMPRLSDRRGRKTVILISLIGSAIAYCIQGLAGEMTGSGVTVFMIGRGLSGFFGGTIPVVRAYITELSVPNTQLLKQRLTMLMVSNQAAGIALAPIAGAIATFGLSLPYYVCSGVAVCILFWAIAFFKEARQLKCAADGPSECQGVSGSESKKIQEITGEQCQKVGQDEGDHAPQTKSPWLDKVPLVMLCGIFSVFLLVSGIALLIPVMLEQTSFGLKGATSAETEGNIAKAFGLVSIPMGVCNILVSVFLFVPVTKRFGDLRVIVTAGVVASVNISAYGFLPIRLWHVCILQAVSGCCFGFITPAVAPLMARYAAVHYPTRMAEAQGIPPVGMNLAMACGQNLMAAVHKHIGMKAAWITGGICICSFMTFFVIAVVLVEKRLPKPEKLSLKQQKAFLELGGMDVDKFIDSMCEEVRRTLSERKMHLWNAPIQNVVQKGLVAAVPQMRNWEDETQGMEYLEDLHSLLQSSPAELSKFHEVFPQISSRSNRLRLTHLDLEGCVPSMFGLAVEAGEQSGASTPRSTPKTGALSPSLSVSQASI